MLAKNPRGGKRLGVGVHLVSIVSVKYARDFKTGEKLELVDTETAEVFGAYEIKYQDEYHAKISQTLWLTPKARWLIDNLLSVIDLDNTESPVNVSKAINKKLFILVAEKRVYRESGDYDVYYEVLPKFMPLLDIKPVVWPVVPGDPARSGGTPHGMFLIEVGKPQVKLPSQQVTQRTDNGDDSCPW